MTTQKGSIQVNTENIFPIIKKFLYSDHEIFLRELVSNAIDATSKLKTLSSLGEFKGELGDLTLSIAIDEAAKTLTIRDRGVGMTAAEIEKYINQVAFSGAEEFVNKYKNAGDANMIGHFGLGFYSSFMVASKVEIITKSFKDEPAARWTCDGSTEYTIEPDERTERGTDIILHIDTDSEEFLKEQRISELLKKYCRFLPVPIQFGTRTEWVDNAEGTTDKDGNIEKTEVQVPNIINNTQPLWKRNPNELKEEDYVAFYRELYPMSEAPLFWIHLNVDYPFNLTGILYFPKVKKETELQRNKIQLYSNQVFVTDEVKDIVPEFLMLLHGVIDSPDIPLNVSRSFLQSDTHVKKITSHITKKVADKLDEIFRTDRAAYEEKWESIGLFVKYGAISDEKFWEKAKKFALVQNTAGKCFTIDEYGAHIEATQTDKDSKVVWLYTTNAAQQHTFIEAAEKRHYEVAVFDGILDNHFISHIESNHPTWKMARVDADAVDKLIDKGEVRESVLGAEQVEALKQSFISHINKENWEIQTEALSPDDTFISLIKPEWERRMKEMSQGSGGFNFYGMMPERFVLLVNTNHRLAKKLADTTADNDKTQLLGQAVDLALLSQNMLEGEALSRFIRRTEELLG